MQLSKKGRKLLLNDDEFIEMGAAIDTFLVLSEDRLVVLLLNRTQLKSDRNIVCYGFDKDKKWQIPKPVKLHEENYYTSIYLSDNNILMAYNVNGVEVSINKHDGTILGKELIK